MHPEHQFEEKRLTKVIEVIRRELEKRTNEMPLIKEQLRALNKDMWDTFGPYLNDEFELKLAEAKGMFTGAVENAKDIHILTRQIKSPYFARIDFQEDGDQTESYYIGLFGLSDQNSYNNLVYDWRAPISGIFYNSEIGRACYECPVGLIEGELHLKRQYSIENGKINFMFDSSVAIEDNILLNILGQGTGENIKTIVNTIQKEQNSAIRYQGRRIFSVQGPAGSGKTSIALHRAAYLLYRHRNTIQAKNLLLFSPNDTFSKYISNVMPELGEDDITRLTVHGLTINILGNQFKTYETYAEMMEKSLTNRDLGRLRDMSVKCSVEFTEAIENFANNTVGEYILFRDIECDGTVLAQREELRLLYFHDFQSQLPAKRLGRIHEIMKGRIFEYEKKRRVERYKQFAELSFFNDIERKATARITVARELEEMKNAVTQMLTLDINVLYGTLLSNCGLSGLQESILTFEDQMPLLYLMSLLGLLDSDRSIKHVIVDEAQDYPASAFKLFAKLYPNSETTLVGDINQNINTVCGIGSLKIAAQQMSNDFDFIELNKCYRSTVEIMAFASRIFSSSAQIFARNGRQPGVYTFKDPTDIFQDITKRLTDRVDVGKTIIICRTMGDCQMVWDAIKDHLPVTLIYDGDIIPSTGTLIIPSYRSKGLEFDAVLAVVLNRHDYIGEDQLLYTVCTRALHSLDLFIVEGAAVVKRLAEKSE